MKTKEQKRIYNKEYRKNNLEKARTYWKEYRKNNPEKAKESQKRSYEKNKHKYHKKRCIRDHKIKIKVLNNYGTICQICGFKDIRALSIDHINGGGCKQRKELKKEGSVFYRWLIKNDFPNGFRTLCMNCQFIEKYKNHLCMKKALNLKNSWREE